MRLEHLLSGENASNEELSLLMMIRNYFIKWFVPSSSCNCLSVSGGLAQLARAPALQAGGQRFESVILHFG